MPIRLTTLGGLTAHDDAVELDWLHGQRLRAALLVYLAVERTVSRAALASVFWPDSDEENARHALRQNLYELRRVLGAEWIDARPRELRVTDRVTTDLAAFGTAVERNDGALAIQLYGGAFLDGVHLIDLKPWEVWVDGQRAQAARSFRKACRAWVESCRTRGDLPAAIAAAQQWTARDPADDEAQHALIAALAGAGHRTDAIRQYETYALTLSAEGLEPLEQTRDLIAAVHRQATVGPTAEDGPAPEATGADSIVPVPRGVVERSGTPRARRVRWKPWVGAACIVAVASLAGVSWLRSRADPAPAAPAVAVLFHNEAGEELDWFATALTSNLGGALASVRALDVRSTYAMRPYRDGATPVPVLADELRVRWLVAGTVNRAGDDIVVQAELIDAGANRRIDAREARGRVGDELTLLTTLVGEVEAMLRRHVGREVRVRDWHAGTRSQRAFQLVHRASQQVSEADRLAEANDLDGAWSRMRLADATLAEAQRADPEWTVPPVERAWLARGIARLLFGNGVVRDSVVAALARGVGHADAALALHDDDARALAARGIVRYELRLLAVPADSAEGARLLDDAEADLQAATAADSTLAAAFATLSSIHVTRGRLEQARLDAERAYHADAWLESANEILARLFNINFEAGDDRQAQRWCAEIGSRFPDLWYGANCRLLLMAWSADVEPDADEAWRLARTATASAPEPIRAMVGAQLEVQLAGVLARLVPPDSVERVLARARASVADDPGNAGDRNARLVLLQYEAAVRVLLGQDEIAARMLAEYFDGRPGDRIQLLRSRRFAALRTDPRFHTGGR